MSDLATLLAQSPDLLPMGYDPVRDAMLFVDFDRAAYAAASFLDERILGSDVRARWVPAAAVVDAASGLPASDCRFIFHIGHVGSTLLARLVGEAGALSLREPAALRAFSVEGGLNGASQSRLDALLRLWSRTYAPEQRPVVKATSFVSEIAGELLARTRQPAVAMTVSAETYLAGILGGENSRREIAAAAPAKARRLALRRGTDLPATSEGEVIAQSWLCEVTALLAAEPADALLWLDFETFLADPAAGLAASLAHLGVAASSGQIAAIATGPLMTRYSKAPEHGYTPALRRAVLEGARADFGKEIAAGLRWLDTAARGWPPAAQALAKAGR